MEQVFGEWKDLIYVRCTRYDNVILKSICMNSEEMKGRPKHFAINVAKLTQQLPETLLNKIYKGQIIRSSSSAAANYRASQRATLRPDFINKRKIVEEELDETLFFWRCLRNSISNILRN